MIINYLGRNNKDKMTELSYQQQLWNIVSQSSVSHTSSYRNSRQQSMNNSSNFPKPPCCLSDLLIRKQVKAKKEYFFKISLEPQHSEQQNPYKKLIATVKSLKTKKLVDPNKIKTFISDFYNTVQKNYEQLQSIEKLLNFKENKCTKIDQYDKKMFHSMKRCLNEFQKVQGRQQMGKFLDQELFLFRNQAQIISTFVSEGILQVKTIFSAPQPNCIPINTSEFSDCQNGISQLKQILNKIQGVVSKQYKLFNDSLNIDAGSQGIFQFLENMKQILDDIAQFCLEDDSLLNRILYYGWMIKKKLIHSFAQLYSKYICSKKQLKGFQKLQEAEGQRQTHVQSNYDEINFFSCSRGFSTQIHIQIYKFYLFADNFIDDSLQKMKGKIGHLLDKIIKAISSGKNKSSNACKYQIVAISSEILSFLPKLQYLILLLNGSKTQFLTEILRQKQIQAIIEVDKLKHLLFEMLNFNESLSYIFWQSYSLILQKISLSKKFIEKMQKKQNKINVQNLENLEIDIHSAEQITEQLIKKIQEQNRATFNLSKCVTALNSLNLLFNKRKQLKGLKNKWLQVQLDYFRSCSVNFSQKLLDTKQSHKNVWESSKFESRIIEENQQSLPQSPMNFNLASQINFSKSNDISMIQVFNSNNSLDNSGEIDIPLTKRKIPVHAVQLMIEKANSLEISQYNYDSISHIISEASVFFQEKFKSIVKNGYELYFYQSGNYCESQSKQENYTQRRSQNSFRLSLGYGDQLPVSYKKRIEKLSQIVESFLDDINLILDKSQSPPKILGKFPENSERIKYKTNNKKTRQSIIKIEIGESSDDDDDLNTKNRTTKNAQQLSKTTKKVLTSHNYSDQKQQLRLTIINFHLIKNIIGTSVQINIDSKVSELNTSDLVIPLEELVQNLLNFEYQNWSDNIKDVKNYIENNLEKKLNFWKNLLKDNSRTIFSDCYKVLREEINLLEIFIDILTEQLLIYTTTKHQQAKRRKSNRVVNITEDQLYYFQTLSRFTTSIREELEQLKSFNQIPHMIRTILFEIFNKFYQNYSNYIGYTSQYELLSKLVQKLSSAVTFKINHQTIFTTFFEQVQANANCMMGLFNTGLNNGSNKEQTQQRNKLEIKAMTDEIKNISKQILMIKRQNQEFIQFGKEEAIQIQGIMEFQDLNSLYNQHYHLAEFIIGYNSKNSSRIMEFKLYDPAIKNIKKLIQQIFRLSEAHKISI